MKKVLSMTLRRCDGSETVTTPIVLNDSFRWTIHHQYCGAHPRVGLFTFMPSYKSFTIFKNKEGVWVKTKKWVPVAVHFTANKTWWRVTTCSFKSWSRLYMRPPSNNLLRHMPCRLYWYPRAVKTFIVIVYLALARWNLPRAVVDAHVLSCFASHELIS